MRLLFVGDVFGEPGRRCIAELVPKLRAEHAVDVVIVNGENAARGTGIGEKHAKAMLRVADGITLGNHAYRQRDIFEMLDTDPRIVRPGNLPAASPGSGLMFLEAREDGEGPAHEIAVINLMGALFLDVSASPWETADRLVAEARARTKIILVDMHAEATSEKVAMGHYLSGKVSAVVGTHTHVQTSDARILGGHTGYITDVGMTGPHLDSVIGVRADIIIRRFRTGIGQRFEPATGGAQLEGVLIDIDVATGRATAMCAVREPL